MLVVASMVFWGTPVTLLQVFGFGIALAGLVHHSSLKKPTPPSPTSPLKDDKATLDNVDSELSILSSGESSAGEPADSA